MQIDKILEKSSMRKDINRKVNDKCSCTLSNICSQMWLQWNLLGVLHSVPSTWTSHDSALHNFTEMLLETGLIIQAILEKNKIDIPESVIKNYIIV
jgi:hypothetical protein